MANHKIEIEYFPEHSHGDSPNRMGWNINNVHDARDKIREQVGKLSKKKSVFKVFHNGKEVYDSKQFNPTQQ